MNRRLAAAALIGLGCAQMLDDVTGLLPLKALAMATNASSPAMKVFTAVRGYEGFSGRFYLEWTDVEGERVRLALTPERARPPDRLKPLGK